MLATMQGLAIKAIGRMQINMKQDLTGDSVVVQNKCLSDLIARYNAHLLFI